MAFGSQGLRIGEAYRLTWNESGFNVDMSKKRPEFVISKKNRKRQSLPMVPEFAKLLNNVDDQTGFVFKVERKRDPGRLSLNRVEAEIARFGKRAGIRVSGTKTATARDFRRSFATRWAEKVLPQVLQKLTSHDEISTTMRYYADIETSRLADKLYDVGTNVGKQESTSVE